MSLKVGLENYKILKTLGTGSFGKVKRKIYLVATHLITNIKVAIKFILNSSNSESSNEAKIKREIRILKKFNHPNIIRLYEYIETEKYIVLVMEYASEGEFYSLLEREGRFSEVKAKEYFKQILSAVEYCHSFRITHRDIKPENLLVDEKNVLKLCDFGLSNYLRDGEFLKTPCGSPNYAPPEILSGEKYCGTEADIWSMGVLLYAIIAGVLPFDESSIPMLFHKIKSGKFKIPHFFSQNLADLVSRMLVPDPIMRITITQIKCHPWIVSLFSDSLLPSRLQIRINHEVISDCLALEQFNTLTPGQAVSLLKKGRNDFTVTYNILLDMKKKSDRSSQRLFRKRTRSVIRDQKFAYYRPDNWVYGLRWNSKSIYLMERLFVALKDNGLEWRIIDNFFLRVRPANEQHTKIRFDLQIYKVRFNQFEESYVIDICKKTGPGLIINEYIARIYQDLGLIRAN